MSIKKNTTSKIDPELLDVFEGLLKLCSDREAQIRKLVSKLEECYAKLNVPGYTDIKANTKPLDLPPKEAGSIYIADRSAFLIKLLTTFLSDNGYKISGILSDGKDLVKQVCEVNPSLMTIDSDLPKINSYQTSYEIKNLMPEIKIVMMIDKLDEVKTLNALRFGVDECIEKPVRPLRLLNAIETLIGAKDTES